MPSYTSPIPFGRAWRAIAAPFILSRAGILIVGLAAAVFIGDHAPSNPSATWRVAADPLHNLLARWDTFWYLDIASRGYHWNGNVLEQQNVVFFPLLPLIMRVVGSSIGGHPLIAALIVSLVAFLCALAYLWRWAAERRGEAVADGAVALLCAFPFAVFFSAAYTESLFLLTIVGAWCHAERRELGPAFGYGLVGGLLRPNGSLLALPLAWLLFVEGAKTASLARVAVVVAPTLGGIAFSAYLASHVGDGFAWMAGQAAWPTIAPWATPLPDGGPPASFDPWSVVIHVANAAVLVLAIASLRPATRMLGVACGLLIVVNLAPPVAWHGLQSLGRFTSVLFPIFVWLADWAGPHRRLWIGTFAAAQVVAAILFFTWRPLV